MFVVIEGGECSGKSTLIHLLKLQYTNAIYTRGLGGSSVGEKIRDILMTPNLDLPKDSKVHFIGASLKSTYNDIIMPNKDNQLVIVDRWIPSFFAYQNARENNAANTYYKQYFDYLKGLIRPDYTFYLEASIDVVSERLKKKHSLDQTDNLDNYYIENSERIISDYQYFREHYESPDKFSLIRTDELTIDETVSLVDQKIHSFTTL